MVTVDDIARLLDAFAPLRLAEDWDNVGLLVGARGREVARLMTCLTITSASAAEAVEAQADLIVVHHPLPFTATRRLTTDTPDGQLLWDLMRAGISVYSPHTAFDSAPTGINQRLAEGLGLTRIAPLVVRQEDVDGGQLGAGRYGQCDPPRRLAEVVERLKSFLGIRQAQVVGELDREVQTVAVACGSGGELLPAARRAECDCFVTGEARFHTALEAEARGLSLILAGHYATERFAVEALAELLAREFPTVESWASRRERDPLVWA